MIDRGWETCNISQVGSSRAIVNLLLILVGCLGGIGFGWMDGIGRKESLCICSHMRVASNKAVPISCFPCFELNSYGDDEPDRVSWARILQTMIPAFIWGSMISRDYVLLKNRKITRYIKKFVYRLKYFLQESLPKEHWIGYNHR